MLKFPLTGDYFNMKAKSLCLILVMVIGLFALALNLPNKQEVEYLRIHIRANSNLTIDQNVKYEIKNKVVEYLSPKFQKVSSKNEAVEIVERVSENLTMICNSVLSERGFNYTAKVKLSNEYFPTRTYENTTLESGFYDAVIIELGDAKGDNWWCVMYPPLCFVNKNENAMQIKYKSRIKEWLNSLFD